MIQTLASQVETANTILAILSIIGMVSAVCAILFFIFYKKINQTIRTKTKFFDLVLDKSILLAWIVALTAMLGSLYYSDIVGYPPCKFCWFQRICVYPQVVLLAIALIKKDTKIAVYSLTLAILGSLFSANHFMLQLTGTSILPCSTIGQNGTTCNHVFVNTFGFVTIPFMCLIAGLLITLAMIGRIVRNKELSRNGV